MKNTTLGLGALALAVVSVGMFANSAFAYRGDPAVKGPNYSTERHEAMEKAFETNNYEAWKNLMAGKGKVTQMITKDNFAKFVEAHELAEKGDIAGVQKIRHELGLGAQNGLGKHMGNRNGMRGANR